MAELLQFLEGLGLPGSSLITLTTFVAGMVLYSIFVFHFYKFIARKDIFQLDLTEYARGREVTKNILKIALYVLEYLFLFPVLSVIWFTVFAGLLALLSAHTIDSILLVSMAIVTTVRVCAYYSGQLAEDVGKSIPFALLGVVTIDGFQELSIAKALAIATEIAGKWSTVLQYLGFIIVLEFVLRVLTIIFRGTVETEEVEEEEDEE